MNEIRDYRGQNLSSIDDSRQNAIKGPQQVDIQKYRLAVNGLVTIPLSLTYDEAVTRHPGVQKALRLDCVEGWSVTLLWEGILVKDLLQPAGVKPEAKAVIFHCADGYTTSNGIPLPPERGYPFHLVAEGKWGYKWARWVTVLELTDQTDYRGYWEKRGYSLSGDLDKEFLEL